MLPLRHRKLWHPRFVHQLAHRRNAQFDRRPAADAVGVRQLGGAGRLHAHAAATSVTSAFRHCPRVRNCRSDNLTASCGGCLKTSCCFECVRYCRLLGLRCAGQGRVGSSARDTGAERGFQGCGMPPIWLESNSTTIGAFAGFGRG